MSNKVTDQTSQNTFVWGFWKATNIIISNPQIHSNTNTPEQSYTTPNQPEQLLGLLLKINHEIARTLFELTWAIPGSLYLQVETSKIISHFAGKVKMKNPWPWPKPHARKIRDISFNSFLEKSLSDPEHESNFLGLLRAIPWGAFKWVRG